MPLPRSDWTPEIPGPLADLRVLDLSRLVAGNVLTMWMADLGAEVVKIEPPTGDPLRAWRVKGVATSWKQYGRNKKSLALDLRKPAALEALRRLVPTAQILVENFRPGTLEKMGLAPSALHALNPRLVIVRITGFGQTGPYRDKPGFGTLVEGMSGFAASNGFVDREPVLPPTSLADAVAGTLGAFAALAALRRAEAGAPGQVIDLPLLEPIFAIMGPQASNFALTGRVKNRTGSRSTTAAPRNTYRTADDRWVCISASMQSIVDRLFRAVGRPDLVENPRYATNALRVEHAAELDAIIGAWIAARPLAQVLAEFDAAEVTCAPVYDISQIVADPHVQARGMVTEVPDSEMGWNPLPGITPRLSATPGAFRSEAPLLGQHNAELLGAVGYDAAALEALHAAGALIDARNAPPTPADAAG